MFQAIGVHGPELTPIASALMHGALVLLAAIMLAPFSRQQRSGWVPLAGLVVVVTALRVVMEPLPNIQPVTVTVLLVGACLGARRGVAFAVLVTLLSNAFIGDGWWTLFQALGWSSVALLGAGLLEANRLRLPQLSVVSVLAAFVFGFVASLSLLDSTMSLTDFFSLLFAGLPYDALHALGNLAVAVWFGPTIHGLLQDTTTSWMEMKPRGEPNGVEG